MFLARLLGPNEFGKMAFLLGTFIAIRQVLDLGASQAFFAFMSKKVRSSLFVLLYILWLLVQFFLVLFLLYFVFKDIWIDLIWRGENKNLIFLAFSASFVQNSVWPSLQQALESQRKTIPSQIISLLIIVFHLGAIFLLWNFNYLNVYFLFSVIVFEYLFASLFVFKFLKIIPSQKSEFSYIYIKSVFLKYFNYCKPIVIYSWCGFLFTFIDTWLLQTYGGNSNQAFFVVSNQIAAIALLATSSFTNIFFKEAVDTYHNGHLNQLRRLYITVSRSMFLISCLVGVFFIPWSKEVIVLLLGESYKFGYLTFGIMLFYPVYQSLGQLNGLLLYATNNVFINTKIGIYFMIISTLFSLTLVTQVEKYISNFNYYSEMIAFKLVIMQFIQVSILSIILSKIIKVRFNFNYQIVVIVFCLSSSFFSKYFINFLFEGFNFLILKIICSGLMYLFFVVVLIYFNPLIVGLSRTQLELKISHFYSLVFR
jgi:O-antigen/teichoic acid export membrane protein